MIWTNYGGPDVLQLRDIPIPTPTGNQVLIKTRAATVTLGDCEMRNLQILPAFRPLMRMWVGWWRPKRIQILGMELAGDVVAVGESVTRFKAGDAVFGTTGMYFGAYAEYACISLDETGGVLTHKPTTLSYEEAAAVPIGGLEALHLLKPTQLQAGKTVLIIGGGGNIGSYAIQIAKYYGAHVTATDSADKHALMRSLGADHVIDYRTEDFTQNGQTYDVIFDVVGKLRFSRGRKSLKPNGFYLMANPRLSHMLFKGWVSKTSGQTLLTSAMNEGYEALELLRSLIVDGRLKVIVDRQFPLEQLPDAHRYLESGQKRGAIIITVPSGASTTL